MGSCTFMISISGFDQKTGFNRIVEITVQVREWLSLKQS